MKKGLVSCCGLQCVRRLKVPRAHGSPLPDQRGPEGEGLSKATRTNGGTPHLNPFPFSEGRGEKSHIRLSDNSAVHGVLKTTSR